MKELTNFVKTTLLLLWQLPQTAIGFFLLVCFLCVPCAKFHKIRKAKKIRINGALCWVMELPSFFRGSFSLGSFIFLSVNASSFTLAHECGHTYASFLLGPMYLPVIGLCGCVFAYWINYRFLKRSYAWYRSFWTEKWADAAANLLDVRY